MVNQRLIEAIVRRLELYFLQENNFQLDGQTYDLILFADTGRYGVPEYNLLLSAALLDLRSQREVTRSLLSGFREIPAYQEYHLLSGLTMLTSTSRLVRNARHALAYRTSTDRPMVEVAGYEVDLGDEPLRGGVYVRSVLLEELKVNAVVEIVFSRDGGLSRHARTIRVGHVTADMVLHGTDFHPESDQHVAAFPAKDFQVSLLHVLRIRPETRFSGYSTF